MKGSRSWVQLFGSVFGISGKDILMQSSMFQGRDFDAIE